MSVIARPPFQLRSLPIPTRWEVTRRNPYYYLWWKWARAEHRRDVIASPKDAIYRQAAIPVLGLIGVSGEPPDPATAFPELGAEDLESGWLSGAVHPVTMRGLAAILIAGLPKDTLRQLGRTLITAGGDDVEDSPPKKIEAMQALTTANWPGLESFPNEPFVSVNPAASERKITEAIDQLLKEWKNQRGLEERRERTDKYDEYLQVWDMREGWSEGVYDRRTERTFTEIAATTKRSVSTLNNQYCRAFELITGHPYSRELWVAMFGPIKIAYVVSAGMSRTQRPMRSPVPRPVPESVISPEANDDSRSTSSIIGSAEAGNDVGYMQLIDDVRTMLNRGRSDAQISEELNLPLDAIAYLRARGDVDSLRP
jgi:hypothetical protein